jgi:hypothetical protein
MFTRRSFAMKHADPLASRHVYVRALEMIDVAADIFCDRILSVRVLICLPTVGWRRRDVRSRGTYHCELA